MIDFFMPARKTVVMASPICLDCGDKKKPLIREGIGRCKECYMAWSVQVIAINRILRAVAIFSVCLLITAAYAHDHNHPELDGWFMSLRSGKGPCCDGSDALRIEDPDWDNDSGHYRVRLEGEWVDVPAEAVIDGPNRDGNAMVWPFRKNGKLDQIKCFLPGSMG